MARVSPVDATSHPELAPLVERIRGGRGGRLLNLYRALLHSPPLAEAWMAFNDAVRRATTLDDRVRELVILRVALANRVAYVFDVHRTRYAAPAGVTAAECDALADWRAAACFDARERALLAYVDAVTCEVQVPEAAFSALRGHFDERAVVEITVLVGAYNLHTRVLGALEVDPEP